MGTVATTDEMKRGAKGHPEGVGHAAQVGIVAVQRDSDPHHVVSGPGMCQRTGRVRRMTDTGIDAGGDKRCQHIIEPFQLFIRIRMIRVVPVDDIGHGEMGIGPLESQNRRCVDGLRQSEGFAREGADTVHSGIDLEVYRCVRFGGGGVEGTDAVKGVHGWREVVFEHDDLGAGWKLRQDQDRGVDIGFA